MSAEDRVTERLRRMRTGIRHIAIGQAYTGKFSEATGALYKNPAITLDTGYVWVRREGSRHATRALNTNGRAPLNKVNVSVIVGERVRDGELEILDADWTTGIAQFGDGVYAAYQPQQTQSTRDIDEGRVYLAQAGTLKFRARPFFYTDSDGNRAWWPDNLGSEVTITLTTASSSEHQIAVIALNPDATTPALTATMSTPVGASQSLTREDAAAVALTSGYVPLAAAHVYHGDATPRGEDHIWDLRPWFEGTGGAPGGLTGLANGGTGSDLSTFGPGTLIQATNGAVVTTRLDNLSATSGPTINDDSGDGYSTGSRWLDVTSQCEYVCLSAAAGAAVWKETTNSGGGLSVTRAEFEMSSVLYDQTLASAVANFDVSSIDQTYDHLAVRLMGRGTVVGDQALAIYFNGDTNSASYHQRRHYAGWLHGTDSASMSLLGYMQGTTGMTDYWSLFEFTIQNYARTTHRKDVVTISGKRISEGNELTQYWTTWLNTAAINRIQIIPASGNFAIGSRLQIIGIKKQSVVTGVSGLAGVSTLAVSNPPSDTDLDTAFGSPADLGAGFVGMLDAGGSGVSVYLATTNGINWFYTPLTKAT